MNTRMTTVAAITALSIIGAACTMPAAGTITQETIPAPSTLPTPDGTVVTVTPPPIPETTTTTVAPEPVRDPAINQIFTNYLTWTQPTHVAEDGRDLQARQWAVGKDQTTCSVNEPHTVSRVFEELAAFPFSGPLSPGLIVEGAGIVDGDLRVVPLGRAPLTIVSSLDSANSVVSVEDPTSAALKQAVTDLKRDADAQFTGIDVTPADITYTREEVHSFEEAFLNMGVSLHYDSPNLRAQFDSSFTQEEASEKHSIVVRLVQPMFTLRADTSTIVEPAEFFAVGTTTGQVDQMINNEVIAAENPPVIIDSVTYGRVMYFTMTNSTVSSASELEVAVEAAWGGVGGEAELTDRQRQVLSESRLEVIAYGGDQDVAFQAIRSGRLADFFSRVNTTTAAPLSMTVRTLDGELVSVADSATVKSLSCDTRKLPYTFDVALGSVNGSARVLVNNQDVGGTSNIEGQHVVRIPANKLRPGANDIEIQFSDWFPCFDAEIDADILVDGRSQSRGRSWKATACWFTWKWSIDTDTGVVTQR